MEVRGGLGLAAERVALGPATLITHTPYHAALRTPSQGRWGRGNTMHLFEPPTSLGRWFDAFDRTIGVLAGVAVRRLAWEQPLDRAVVVPDDVAVDDTTQQVVLVLDGESDSPPMPRDVEVRDTVTGEIATMERTESGARTLYLQGGWGTDVERFRWRSAEESNLEASDRGRRFVAYRFGIPIARIGAWHDRGGLAVLDALVVHPLCRGQGIGAALAGHAADHLRATLGQTSVVALAPDDAAARVAARMGMRPASRIVQVARAV